MKQEDLLVGMTAEGTLSAHPPDESAERRKNKRFAVSASAEAVESRTQTRLTGRASDLGIGGCYIDTVSPFPTGTPLLIYLMSGSHSVKAKAKVVYALAGMGMGLAFTEVTADQREKLTAWLRELSGERLLVETRTPEIGKPMRMTKSNGLRETMQELISLLGNKRVLSEAEVEFLRNKMTD